MVELESILVGVHRQNHGTIVIQILNRPAFGLEWVRVALAELPDLIGVVLLPEEGPQTFELAFDHRLGFTESRTMADWAREQLTEADRRMSPRSTNYAPSR
jgi:hypothetical protein